MNCDVTKFEEYLRNRHYSEAVIRTSRDIAKRLLNIFSVEEIIHTGANELIDKLNSDTTSRSKAAYRTKAAEFKRYLMKEAQAMIPDLSGYEEYLKSQRLVRSTVMDAMRIARTALARCTVEEIRSKDVRDIVSKVWGNLATETQRYYRRVLNKYKSYLDMQEESA